jgi:hypothetical protein
MKSGFGLIPFLFLICAFAVTRVDSVNASVGVVFAATTPCKAEARSILKIPPEAKCELIKWQLKLYQNPPAGDPTKYELECLYGLPLQGTNGLIDGGTALKRAGKWKIVKGTAIAPRALVYKLESEKPADSVSFQLLDPNLLHLLDTQGRLVVGTAGWSYTLNRDKRVASTGEEFRPATSRTSYESRTAGQQSPPPSAFLRFAGRTPCLEIAKELGRNVSADCAKLKWDLTLYRDPQTGRPTTFKLNGTLYRSRIAEGQWTRMKGIMFGEDMVIYRLDPGKPSRSLFLLKVDENLLLFLEANGKPLVGNRDFSYTLNRTED